jgi:hypothetical protein
MSHDVLWTPEKQRESAIPLSPIMQRVEELEREVREIKRTMSMPEQRPENWRDVTGKCTVSDDGTILYAGKVVMGLPMDYRLRKVRLDQDFREWEMHKEAFIVERREP